VQKKKTLIKATQSAPATRAPLRILGGIIVLLAGIAAWKTVTTHSSKANPVAAASTPVPRSPTTNFILTIPNANPRAEDFPAAPPENLVAGSVVFSPPDRSVPLNDHFQWWSYVRGANWRHPFGPKTDIKGKETYPVVHIAYEDPLTYAKWANKRLPTEAEWEFAERGGLSGKPFVWGDQFRPDGKWMCTDT